MKKTAQVEVYYSEEHPFREGINLLRRLALTTDAEETFKWSLPVYTVEEKNVFGICRFKHKFGIWFFNGALLTDPKGVLQNAQEGKTKAMRHWNFTSITDIDSDRVLAYMKEAIENQKKGKAVPKEVHQNNVALDIPPELSAALQKNATLQKAFESLTAYKQKEFAEFIREAKRDTTKQNRLAKILPMIQQGIGLNDKYR